MSEKTKKNMISDWFDRRDFVGLTGIVLIGLGCWWIFPPAGLIVPGMILSWVAIFGVRK